MSKFVHFQPNWFSKLVHCVANEPQSAAGWEQWIWPGGQERMAPSAAAALDRACVHRTAASVIQPTTCPHKHLH